MTELEPAEINVFVSCPGDVKHEKQIIRNTCDSLNEVFRQNGAAFRFNIQDWSNIIAAWGKRPQQVINDQFDGYNIYIGILWMRFGSNTGKVNEATGDDFGSGTYEEFIEAVHKFDEDKPIEIYLFFKEGIGVNDVEASEQRTNVLRFKDEVSARGWTNSFKPNEDSAFTNKVRSLLDSYVRKLEKQKMVELKADFVAGQTIIGISLTVAQHNAKWATKLPPTNFTIPRSFSQQTERLEGIDFNFSSDQSRPTLSKIILENKLVTILGTAGSGKSTELIALANHFSNEDSPLVPVYRRLNSYVDEKLDDFLPAGWAEIPPEICLILLDGLDEIQPVHFNTAIKRISSFTERHPEIRLVVSCRTNFYDFIDIAQSGTLPEFVVFHINPLNEADLQPFLERAQQIDSQSFFTEVRKYEYDELILQPFFLNIILSEYKSTGNLKISKSALFAKFINARIIFDQNHFKTIINLKTKREEVLSLLQRVALLMEATGKNFISTPDLLEIIDNIENINLLKHCTAFNLREEDGDSWSFEHNNVQEYLAAKYLSEFDVNNIKTLISYNLNRIKPNWVNTLFFLIGIIESEKKAVLIDWMVVIEPETLVRMEPEHVNETLRMQIFTEIFNHYKSKDIYLRSNKFSNVDLARFAPQEQAVTLLTKEFTNEANTKITRITALNLICLMEISHDVKTELKAAIISYTCENKRDFGLFYVAVRALISINLASAADLEKLMTIFGHSANQDARAALYELILELDEVEKYDEYLLEGIQYLGSDHAERSTTSFFDEEWTLKLALSKLSSNKSLIKVFKYFQDPSDIKHAEFFDKEEVLKALVEKAILKGTADPSLFESLVLSLIGYAAYFDTNLTENFAAYFFRTGSQIKAFQKIYQHSFKPLEERWRAIAAISDENVLEYIKNEYLSRSFNNQQIIKIFNNLNYSFYLMPNQVAFRAFETWIRSEEHLIEEIPVAIDPGLNYSELQKQDFQLYFNQPKLISAIENFFQAAGIETISRTDLRKYRSYSGKDIVRLPEPINRLTVRLTHSDQDQITKEQILEFITDQEKLQPFVLNQIYLKAGNQRTPDLSNAQKEIVIGWVNDLVQQLDIPKAIKYQDNSSFVNEKRKAVLAWFFVRRLHIPIPENKMLDFTLLHVDNHTGQPGTDFPYLEKHVAKPVLIRRVKENLSKELVQGSSWRSHAIYVIKNKVSELFPLVIDHLLNPEYGYPFRAAVLKELVADHYDGKLLMLTLKKLGKDVLKWDVVDNLKADPLYSRDLIAYLNEILTNQENAKDMLAASKVLTELNQLNGFLYFTDKIIENNSDDFYGISLFQKVINPQFIERLIEMMKLKENLFSEDRDKIFDLAWQGLWSIGLASESNMERVIQMMKSNVKNNIEFIERLQDEFFIRHTEVQSLQSAIKMVDNVSRKL